MNRFPPVSSAALVSAAALGAAAALLRRLLRHRAVEQAVRATRTEEAAAGGLSTSDAEDAGSPAETVGSGGLPARTWVVDNNSNWDGSPLELVVAPGNGSRPGPERN